jgi:hypothetical protein
MFAPLILGVIAIYMVCGWIVLAALDRRVARNRSGGMLWIAVLVWPITIVADLISRGGANKG